MFIIPMSSVTCDRNKGLLWDILSAAGVFSGLEDQHYGSVTSHLEMLVKREAQCGDTVSSAQKNKNVIQGMVAFVKTLHAEPDEITKLMGQTTATKRRTGYQRRSTI